MNEIEKNNKLNNTLLVATIIYLIITFLVTRIECHAQDMGCMVMIFVIFPPMIIFSFILGIIKISFVVRIFTFLFSVFMTVFIYGFSNSFHRDFSEDDFLFLYYGMLMPFIIGWFILFMFNTVFKNSKLVFWSIIIVIVLLFILFLMIENGMIY